MLRLADLGWRDACRADEGLAAGLNTHAGKLTNYAVGRALEIDVTSPQVVLKS